MKCGKFEISEYLIGAIAIIALIAIALHATLEEERIREKTKQLELEKEIIMLEQNQINNEKEN